MDPSQLELRQWTSVDWVIGALMVALLLLTVLRVRYPKRFQEFALLPITDKYFSLPASTYQLIDPFNAALLGFQAIVLALFFVLFRGKVQNSMEAMDLWYFLQIFALLTMFLLGKFLIEQFMGWLFDIRPLVERFLFEKLSYLGLISILIFGFCWVILLLKVPLLPLFLVGSVVLVGVYLISLLSSFKRNWNLIIRHFFYFILYLCALEIAPFVLLYYAAV